MRRILSIFLLLFLGLGPLAATLQAGDDARLPSCCRRNGTHHCAMPADSLARVIQAVSGTTPVIGAPAHCKQYPGAIPATISPNHALAASAIHSLALSTQARLALPSLETALNSEAHTHAGRGPPFPHWADIRRA